MLQLFFQEANIGSVEKWLKKEGDHFHAGETICEVTIEGVTLGIDQKEPGVIAEILASEESEVPVGKSLAIVVGGNEEYEAFVAKYRNIEEGAVSEAGTGTGAATVGTTSSGSETDTGGHSEPAPAPAADHISNITLIKTAKNLIKTNAINGEDSFAHDLLSLCRQGNPDLIDAFEASFDGDDFNEATFDADFFISNAKSIVSKNNVAETK